MARTRPFGTVVKLPSGRYRARYWKLGKQVSAPSTFTTKSDARAWLSTIETDLARGVRIDPKAGSVRFDDYAERWMAQRRLRPHTRETYSGQLRRISKQFGRAELRSITPADVRQWHGELLNSDLHPNTVAKIYRLFRTIMGTAVEDSLLPSNPVSVKGAAVEHSVERQLLTWSDVQAIGDAIHPRFRALVWTAATSGLRYGELTGLTRRHVDLGSGVIRVEQALGFISGVGPSIVPPKSDAAHRRVSIPATTVDVLRWHLDTYVDPDADTFIFTSVKGSPLLNRYFAPYWSRAKATAGIDAQYRFHDLRHLAGTTAASAGASLREVMARMGHASSDASLRYLKASERRDEEIADAIGARMSRDLGSS